MTLTEKKLILDHLEEIDKIQEKYEQRLNDQEIAVQSTIEAVASMEQRMSSFEPVLAGIDGKLNELLKEKREKEIVDAAIKSTPGAQFVAKLKVKLIETLILMISGFLVAAVVGIFILLFKAGAFKALGWG